VSEDVRERSLVQRSEGRAFPPVFVQLLVNTLITGVTSTFLWFALTFWVYLETRSVVATGVVGGAFSLSSALLGPVFGTFVDRHRKRNAMLVSIAFATACFAGATAVFFSVPSDELLELTSPWFWLLVGLTLLGSVAGQMRGIALSTCVTLLVPAAARDRANGMVGTITGVSFALTSVFSGLAIGTGGMGWSYLVALGLTVVALAHMATIRFHEPDPDPAPGEPFVDISGALESIRAVPGLGMLIFLTAFNNLLGGVFMALMDAYGLELVSVQAWGILWGVISLAFIAGGLVVARRGLGPNPVRLIITLNLVNWMVCSLFTVRSSIVLVAIGMVVWLGLFPAIEAAEQTVLQRRVPFERQGRVFGFAALLENATSPLTAFAIAPLAEAVFMPTMTDGLGADWIGRWFDTGPERGIALLFTLAGIIGIVVTLLVRRSRSFGLLADSWDGDGRPEPVRVG
jgi:DHA3 family multidrug efflux protein-like MFS transporter